MPRPIIATLTDEQEAMIPIYREKWRPIAMSTEPIDREKVAAVIKVAYLVSDYPEPEILFYSSPFTAIQEIVAIENFKAYLGRSINTKFSKRVFDHVRCGIMQQLDNKLFDSLRNRIQFPEFPHYWTESNTLAPYFPWAWSQCLENQIMTDFFNKSEVEFNKISYLMISLTRPPSVIWGCLFDFCISVLGLHHDKKKWQAIQELIQHCGLIFQFENVCIACDRPCSLSFDRENRLHAEGKPALQFPDGYSVYAYHGRHPSD